MLDLTANAESVSQSIQVGGYISNKGRGPRNAPTMEGVEHARGTADEVAQ